MTVKTLTLTDKEAYILGCIMGYVKYSADEDVNSLLNKVDELENEWLTVEDYDCVKFETDENGNTIINFSLPEENVIGEALNNLSRKLQLAMIQNDLEAVDTYSRAIQRLKSV